MCARRSNSQKQAPVGEKKIRTCVNCGEKLTKQKLLRVVRRADGTCVFDETGRVAGRGAYACSSKCMEQALKTGKLSRTLRVSLDAQTIEDIRNGLAESTAQIEQE